MSFCYHVPSVRCSNCSSGYWDFIPHQPRGWICPRCQTVHSPNSLTCWCRPDQSLTVITKSGISEDQLDALSKLYGMKLESLKKALGVAEYASKEGEEKGDAEAGRDNA